MSEVGSRCPECGARKPRLEGDVRYCGMCGHEFEPYRLGAGDADLEQQARLADALHARWTLYAERFDRRAIVLTALVNELTQPIAQHLGRASAAEQRELDDLLTGDRRFNSARKLLENLERRGKVRRVQDAFQLVDGSA
jgi:uncharacterized Zn finger protein (UPF0148 family)